MAVIQSYAVWNNKGGVGKSTITFHAASRYAELNPDKKVLVIDLCPQSNSSMMLLGGGVGGENSVLNLCTQPVPKTVVGYLSTVIAQGAGAPLPKPADFIVQASSYNSSLPGNIFLLCGDGNLEPMSPAISQAAAAPALTPSSKPWNWIHSIFKNFIASVEKADASDWMVFIDTNPSFAIYTELAVSAATRLITPVNADDSSRVAANAMLILLHGQTPPHPIYGAWTYAVQAHAHGLPIPQIHVVVGNRLTQHGGLLEHSRRFLMPLQIRSTRLTKRTRGTLFLGRFRRKSGGIPRVFLNRSERLQHCRSCRCSSREAVVQIDSRLLQGAWR